jgi:hypothetical protein
MAGRSGFQSVGVRNHEFNAQPRVDLSLLVTLRHHLSSTSYYKVCLINYLSRNLGASTKQWEEAQMMDSSGEFVSQYLDMTRDEIRLLMLQPGIGRGLLQCSLTSICLPGKKGSISISQSPGSCSSPPAYEALSYVWKDLPGHQEISINQIKHEITSNLAEALYHLRFPAHQRILWVDAICINQGDPQERSHQVQLMREIYRHASEVAIWLGPASKTSDQAIQDLKSLGEDNHLDDHPFFGSQNAVGKWQTSEANRIQPLNTLLERAYFSRIWVVQEAVLAGKGTVYCGEATIPWSTFLAVSDNWKKHSRKCCNGISSQLDSQIRRTMNLLSSSWRRFSAPGDRFKEFPLPFYLNLLRSLKATDPRDKIYGALGLVDRDHILLPPDYGMDMADVFMLWTAEMISIYKSLDVLVNGSFSQRKECIPSWVPDWDFYNPHVRFQTERMEHHRHLFLSFNAGQSSQCLSATLAGKTLKLKGKFKDTIVKVAKNFAYNRQDHLSGEENEMNAMRFWESVFAEWFDMVPHHLDESNKYPTGGSYKEAFWRTAISDHVTDIGTWISRRTNSDDGIRFWAWYEWWKTLIVKRDEELVPFYRSSLAASRDLDIFDWSIVNMNFNCRLFVSEAGLIGMGPADTEVGDEIFVLHGGNTPFILRLSEVDNFDLSSEDVEQLGEMDDSQNQAELLSTENKEKERQHYLIGYAYVHGIMDGSGVEEDWEDLHLI